MNILTKEFWESQYIEGKTGWNIGTISEPLKKYIDQLSNKNIKILIPGAGNAYEAEYLYKSGFQNVYILDIAAKPIENFTNRFPEFPKCQLIECDFFHHQGQYDLIIEQTFFCALFPELRQKYIDQMFDLLKPSGKLVGLLFNVNFGNPFPPFGGNTEEYINLFSPKFEIKVLEKSYNSIKPRAESELFHIFLPKK